MSRILLVEDDADVRAVFEHVLLDAGYEVDVAETILGGEMLLSSRGYSLVLTDGRLPDGVGTMLADQATAKGIPTIIVSGYAFNLREDDPGVDLSKYNLLLKPVRPHELIREIKKVLSADQNENAASA
jgi:DNA-binding NtrC family response regulator